MRRIPAFLLVLAVLAAPATAAPVVAADRSALVDRIVAKADPELLEVLVTTRSKRGAPQFESIRVPTVAAAKRVVTDRLGQRGVVAVEMNQRVYAIGFNDPEYVHQWALDSRHFQYTKIYPLIATGTIMRVAVIDSGVQASHPDLAGHVIAGESFVGGSEFNDTCAHGTHVAGIIGAYANNRRGVVGLARRVYIMPLRVLNKPVLSTECRGTGSDVAEAIVWAADHGARVLNLSLGSSRPLEAQRQAVAYAQSLGSVVVAAAGNRDAGEPNEVIYPAGYSLVLGVGAVGPRNDPPYWRPASFSNAGYWVDVAAPGVRIHSTIPGGEYAPYSGTSMASPYAAAAVALAIQRCRWSGRIAFDRIQRTASHFPSKYSTIGYGLINPLKLLRCV